METTLVDREVCNEFRTYIQEMRVVTHFKNCLLVQNAEDWDI
jgi:hypothetical protein